MCLRLHGEVVLVGVEVLCSRCFERRDAVPLEAPGSVLVVVVGGAGTGGSGLLRSRKIRVGMIILRTRSLYSMDSAGFGEGGVVGPGVLCFAISGALRDSGGISASDTTSLSFVGFRTGEEGLMRTGVFRVILECVMRVCE
jgi:hypothetical protein